MAEIEHPSSDAAAGDAAGTPELAEVQRRLEALQDAARVFAHDFKNPLSALLLGLQRLSRFAAPDHQLHARTLAARLESTIQTMNRLVDGLADLSRWQGGALHLERSRHPAADVLARAVEPLRAGAAERHQQLALELGAELPEVEWDAERVIRALQHLLSRALQATPEGGTVRCSAELSAGRVIVTVEGPPRPGPALEPPVAAEANRPRRQRDLELLAARALAEAHGGGLASEEPLGRGPVFRLNLPVSAAVPG